MYFVYCDLIWGLIVIVFFVGMCFGMLSLRCDLGYVVVGGDFIIYV